jgi:hypothetical protein
MVELREIDFATFDILLCNGTAAFKAVKFLISVLIIG